jgi:hypothetical protein
MNDPHVEALHYSVRHAEDVDYEKAAPCRHYTAGFTVRIEADRAEVTMKTHHATVETARAEVEPFLRAWELTAALQLRPGEFEFAYDRAAIIDRNPTPGSTVAIIAEMGLAIDSVRAHVGRSKYPDPPPVGLERDATVEMMFDRFRLYRTGRTTLGDAANYCLTVLEYAAVGRKRAAQRYNIAMTILNTLGGLAGEKGGEEARKARGASKPFTGAEAIRTRFRSRSRWPSCRRSRRHSGLVGVGTRIGTGRPSTGQDRAGKDTTATGLRAAENLTPWYGTGQARTAPSALANRRLQPTPLFSARCQPGTRILARPQDDAIDTAKALDAIGFHLPSSWMVSMRP